MVVIILVHFAALCCVVFTHQDSLEKGDIQTTFEFRNVQRKDATTTLLSFEEKLQCVNSEPSNLKLAAFNVQIFGTRKMTTPGVPEILVKVSSAYFV